MGEGVENRGYLPPIQVRRGRGEAFGGRGARGVRDVSGADRGGIGKGGIVAHKPV